MGFLIFKYLLDPKLILSDNSLQVDLPKGAKVLSVGFQLTDLLNGDHYREDLFLWAQFDSVEKDTLEPHYFVIAPTGKPIVNTCGQLIFVGTALSSNTKPYPLVIHVFERVSAYY